MNRFDFDHPMYVHLVEEPKRRVIPTISSLCRDFPIAASLNCRAGIAVARDEPYPDSSWSISRETLDLMHEIQGEFQLFIEIGTFVGQGVLAIHRYLAERSFHCPIVTVDTYAGTLMLDYDYREPQGVMRYFDPAVLGSLFTRRGLGHGSFPVQATSRDFFRKFFYLGHQASHIYLDASHEYLDIYEEMRLAWECLAEGGVLAGHDYNWATVKAAVDRFCFERRLQYRVTPGQTHGDITSTQWVIAAKNSAVRHDDQHHSRKAVA